MADPNTNNSQAFVATNDSISAKVGANRESGIGRSSLSPMPDPGQSTSVTNQSPQKRIASQILEIDQTQNISLSGNGMDESPLLQQHQMQKYTMHPISPVPVSTNQQLISSNTITTIN